MHQKLKERVSLREYFSKLIKEITEQESNYLEEVKESNPEKYIRNEYKIIYK